MRLHPTTVQTTHNYSFILLAASVTIGMKKQFSRISDILKAPFLGLIRLYRRFISPMKAPCCRFYPTCSQYAHDAIEKHGVLKGSGMAAWRLLRCNPFGKGGYDPVK